MTDQTADAGSDATFDADYADSVDNVSWFTVVKKTPVRKENSPQDFVVPHSGVLSVDHPHSSSFSVRGQGGMAYTRSPNNRGLQPNLMGTGLQHKSTLDSVYLAYSRVSPNASGSCISLMQIATAVMQSLGNALAVDAVQPMQTGWWVYLKTQADRVCLIEKGISLNGKHIPLHSVVRSLNQKTVKITIKDLPLHEVNNLAVLEVLSALVIITSEVKYSMIWHNSQATSIRNSD